MVRITIQRRWGGYTFLLNGRDDVVADPEWGLTTFRTKEAALETAVLMVQAMRKMVSCSPATSYLHDA